MADYSIPDIKNRAIAQPNDGDAQGNIFASFNMDLLSNRGKMRVSPQVKKAFSDEANADFNGYAGVIFPSTVSLNDKLFACAGEAFSTDIDTPTTGWQEENDGDEPTGSNARANGVFFDNLTLISEGADIKSWNGSTWESWWQGTLGQSALTTERHYLKVGANGNLYLTNDGKTYVVTSTGSVSLTGAGTLDLSATPYKITCMEPSSTRMWQGTRHDGDGEAVIVEWDMSANASTPNRLHRIGSTGVRCIAIWNDIPVAILASGKVKYFNGVNFIDFEGVQFPVGDSLLEENFVHPNGWDIIDDLPHFLVTGRVVHVTDYTGTAQSPWAMPAGVWCLDPKIGLYHRFALGTGESTQEDYGKLAIAEVGALYAIPGNSDTKFLASYEYYLDDAATKRSVLVYHDSANSQPSRGFIVTPFFDAVREVFNTVEAYYKRLATGEKMRFFYRYENAPRVILQGIWVSSTQFNALATDTGILTGNLVMIKGGKGSGQIVRVESVEESTSVTSIIIDEANAFVTAEDNGVLEVIDFKFMGAITGTTRETESFSFPESTKRRRVQVLVEYRQAALNRMETDYIIIES